MCKFAANRNFASIAKFQEMPFLQARLAKFSVSADGEFVQVPLAQITCYQCQI